MPVEADTVGPRQHGPRGEFRAIVADDHRRHAVPCNQTVELACDPPAADRGVGDRRQAPTGEVVHDRQNPEPPSPGQHIGDEVERPALVGCLRQGDRCARAGCALAATAAANRQALLAIEPVQLLVV
jgi:hypothetical protein